MKAVILAGGEGTRLRPLSLNRPKPMVSFFEKPVLEYTLEHLKQNGITDMVTTLQTLPHAVIDHFGNGSAFGVNLLHRIEEKPLGTAGAVKACEDTLDDQPFVVISGDGICNFDLRSALAFHQEKQADVTILLHRQSNLLSYGLVMTNPNGQITRFIEKPSWGQVFADTVNTGIYIINPTVLASIPTDTFYDFARDLFPWMLARGKPLYGYVATGSWCDIGDTDAYLQCTFDVLEGKINLGLTPPSVGRGLWSSTPIPVGTQLIPPCYLGAGVKLGQGVRLGPYVILTAGTTLGDGVVVERSYLDGVGVGAHADISGAIVSRGCHIGQGARLHEGSVLGEGVTVGDHGVVLEESRIWPDKILAPGTRVRGSLSSGTGRGSLFDGTGCLSGQPNVDFTPDIALRLGAAMAAVVSSDKNADIAVSWQGGNAARMLTLAIEAGVIAAGCSIVRHDAAFLAGAAFTAGLYRFPLSVFLTQTGNYLKLHLLGPDGLPIERALELKLEAITARGEVTYQETRGVGATRTIAGMTALYEMSAAEKPNWFQASRTLSLSVRGGSVAGQSLYQSLRAAGCILRQDTRLPLFEIDSDGLTVTAVDEEDRAIPHERLLSMLCLYEASKGNTTLAVPYAAPMLLDHMGGRFNLQIKRVGRDPGARELLAEQPYMHDGIYMINRLAAAMITSGQTLAAMNDALPPFFLSSIEIPLEHDRGAIMRTLAESCNPQSSELVEGLRSREATGWVHVAPMPGRRALRITAEGVTAELAAELCHQFRIRALEADGDW